MNLKILLKKILKRVYFIFYLNRKKRIYRFLTHISLNKNPNFLRLSSEPFVSGDTFRKFSDHIFDETKKIDPKKVSKNDFVFLKTDLIEIFFEEYHPHIENKYNLISHNSDRNLTQELYNYSDEKIITWFAQNLCIKKTNTLLPLPIGLENLRYLNNGILKDFKTVFPSKNKFILSSFNQGTNPSERINLLKLSTEIDNIDVINYLNHKDYIEGLSAYMYNLCPVGNGSDTHRLWESLMVGTIPIMIKSDFSLNFLEIGIPILLVNEWNDLQNLGSDYLNENYTNLSGKETTDKYVSFIFWREYLKKNLPNIL
jgi:hypothetical protein